MLTHTLALKSQGQVVVSGEPSKSAPPTKKKILNQLLYTCYMYLKNLVIFLPSALKEKESDRLRKKRCIQGESSGDR